MTRFFRLGKAVSIILCYRLDQLALSGLKSRRTRTLVWLLTLGRKPKLPCSERLRPALEQLGLIFAKSGQVLSTRRDLLPPGMTGELAKLQGRVPPFNSKVVITIAEKSLGKPLSALFHRFGHRPVASMLIVQMHFATLRDGPYDDHEVAVKILRPNMLPMINSDLTLMRDLAAWVEKLWADAKRLKPHKVVAEFDRYLHGELSLMHEVANISQLHRDFAKSDLLLVPEAFWDWCTSKVLVMERIHGMRISYTEELRTTSVDIHKFARDDVEIFLTQVFRDGSFHADMHPGSILVSMTPKTLGRYITLDFGIVGTLSRFDKNHLAQNFLAFFQCDHHRVAVLHIESGWAPGETRVEELEGAIRACRKPYFDRPLGKILLDLVLIQLSQTSRRFNAEVQPQLVLLQKTLFDVEGLGRQLDPDLDLWKTARPFLERWMYEQID